MKIIQEAVEGADSSNEFLSTIAPTRSLLRLLTLVLRSMAQKEPVLLVGTTATTRRRRNGSATDTLISTTISAKEDHVVKAGCWP